MSKTKAINVLKPTRGCSVAANEHEGRVEVITRWNGEMCRVLCDKDGIHVGSVVKGG